MRTYEAEIPGVQQQVDNTVRLEQRHKKSPFGLFLCLDTIEILRLIQSSGLRFIIRCQQH